ncbi:hypothetical protein Patl1_29555 [Pistacia atlantica]|uniref:Uncharacterized protein n=1 Tax=Pistacia atlantica TaxID=434234 RepID=A0ACC1AGE5_9ROSI|nr:hypothetical protein Patl1_29555 [Pistacia atlantica]
MTGNVLLNGKKRELECGGVAYVTQENILLGTLTIRETITYSAHLRLPSTVTKEEITAIVEGTIMEMGLQDCADRVIGNWHLRGISGGEKKRLSIALEILTRPQLLFLDEPTSGLDSASAFFVVKILKNLAHDGRTVISAIHQPSSEVFALFDDLFLLSGGETVYFGEAKMASKFFAEAGFPCPTRRNPSDHFLRCINSDFDIITEVLVESRRIYDIQNPLDPLRNLSTAEIRRMLIRKYKCSEYAARARGRIRGILTIEGLLCERRWRSQAKWWKQLSTLTQRSIKNMSRDLGYYWLRIAIYIVLSICVGTVFFDIGTSYTAILARVVESCMMMIASVVPNFMMGIIVGAGYLGIMMMTAGFFRLLPELPKIFWRYPVSYVNHGAWALQGAYKNDMIGLEFDSLEREGPKLKGEVILTTILGINPDHSKWWDLVAVIAILLSYRLLFFAILKFREKASPIFRTLYAKRTLEHLKKRPSFRKMPPFPSKRHHVQHSLSSQEGLNSPIQQRQQQINP